jgi:ABC-type multidrug transport system permease subunit
MVTWTLANKDFHLLLRDKRSLIILIGMPFIFILVLGLSLGEGFGQKPDDRLRVSVVDLDQGFQDPADALASPYGNEPWAQVVLRDLAQTAGIRVEIIASKEEAERAVHNSRRAAVLVFGPDFSARVARTSFLAEGINPFYRDGVRLEELDAELLKDPTQLAAASIIDQVSQVTLLRVVLPWMIGRAFEKLGDPVFMDLLGKEVPGYPFLPQSVKRSLGDGVQSALERLYPRYNLKGKTWAKLTKSDPRSNQGQATTVYSEEGTGLINRGAQRYQILVPSYTVMFAFFLVLTVGWLFVAERRQGTLKRLRAAPLSKTQLLLGKLVPCFLLSLLQGFLLLAAGKVVFGMSWGTRPGMLAVVVVATSLAAMGLALLVAALARTETQVAVYGTLLVLVLAGVSGCLMGDREMMPPTMQEVSLFTPHAWALTAYRQLLTVPDPNMELVGESCAVLAGFGSAFVVLAWYFLKWD